MKKNSDLAKLTSNIPLFVALGYIVGVVYIKGYLHAWEIDLKLIPISVFDITSTIIKISPYLVLLLVINIFSFNMQFKTIEITDDQKSRVKALKDNLLLHKEKYKNCSEAIQNLKSKYSQYDNDMNLNSAQEFIKSGKRLLKGIAINENELKNMGDELTRHEEELLSLENDLEEIDTHWKLHTYLDHFFAVVSLITIVLYFSIGFYDTNFIGILLFSIHYLGYYLIKKLPHRNIIQFKPAFIFSLSLLSFYAGGNIIGNQLFLTDKTVVCLFSENEQYCGNIIYFLDKGALLQKGGIVHITPWDQLTNIEYISSDRSYIYSYEKLKKIQS